MKEKFKTYIPFLNRYSLVFHFILSCILTFFIEVVSRHSIRSAFAFMDGHTLAFLYNAFIIFASLALVYLFKCRAQMRILISAVWLILGIANGCILANRVTPFGYTDLKLVPDLFAMQNTNYFTKGQLIAVILAILVFIVSLILFFVKGPRFQGKLHKIWGPTWVAALILIGVPVTTQAAQESNVLATYFANIAQGYSDYGFVYGFSTSVVGRGMDKPDAYSQESIEILMETTNDASEDTSVTAETAPNIICILLESFCDPYEINFLEMSKDPVPTFHYLEENFSSGYLTVPVIGAGTANTEFEVLTGMSMQYFGTGEYPYKTILKETDCESIASALSGIGYSTHVVHNNTATFYSRNNAFSMMGFDTFTSKELMNITELTPTGSWATDDVLVEETIKAMDATENQPDFVYTITVEAHGDYPSEKLLTNPEITVTTGKEESVNNQWEYYINMLHEVDNFIADLIKEVEARGEDTIIVMFGDHLPTMGLTNFDMKSNDIFKTKYITWNNMGLEKEDAELTTYQLLSHVTDQLGIHEGTVLRYNQTHSDKFTYLVGLEQLQYDLLYGNRYAYNGEMAHTPSDLIMDVEDVNISHIYESEFLDRIVVYGENFTKNTKIFVNGEKIATGYESPCMLTAYVKDIPDNSAVTVKILGSKGIVLRESPDQLLYTVPNTESTETTEATVFNTETELINQ